MHDLDSQRQTTNDTEKTISRRKLFKVVGRLLGVLGSLPLVGRLLPSRSKELTSWYDAREGRGTLVIVDEASTLKPPWNNPEFPKLLDPEGRAPLIQLLDQAEEAKAWREGRGPKPTWWEDEWT